MEGSLMTKEYMAHYNCERDHQGLDEVTPSSVYFTAMKWLHNIHKNEGGFILEI